MRGKIKTFFIGGAFFALLSMIAKGVGALYRIPLTNIMGAEGIGLYQMVFPLYSVLLTVSSGGLPSAISKTVAEFKARGDDENARKTLFVTLAALVPIGAVASVALALLRNKIAFLQGNPDAADAYLGIAPSVLLVCVISCFRGYFQGNLNMLPSGISQVVEQVGKLVAGLMLCSMLYPYGVKYAALGALIGVSVSEFAALLILFVQFLFSERKRKKSTVLSLKNLQFEAGQDNAALSDMPRMSSKGILKRVYRTALPVTLGSLVIPSSAVIDSVLVINLLVSLGLGVSAATSLFGLLNGPINSLINMPVVITTAVSIMLVPKISGAIQKGRDSHKTVADSFKFALLIAFPCAAVLGLFPHEILSVLYKRSLSPELLETGKALMSIGALSVIYMSILQVATAVLQAYDKAHKPAVNLIIGACVKVVLTIVLLKIFGITGAVTASVVCYALTCLLDVIAMNKQLKVRLDFKAVVVAGLMSSALLIVSAKLLYFLLKKVLSANIALILALAIGALVYVAGLLLLKGIKKEEIMFFKSEKKSRENKKQ